MPGILNCSQSLLQYQMLLAVAFTVSSSHIAFPDSLLLSSFNILEVGSLQHLANHRALADSNIESLGFHIVSLEISQHSITMKYLSTLALLLASSVSIVAAMPADSNVNAAASNGEAVRISTRG